MGLVPFQASTSRFGWAKVLCESKAQNSSKKGKEKEVGGIDQNKKGKWLVSEGNDVVFKVEHRKPYGPSVPLLGWSLASLLLFTPPPRETERRRDGCRSWPVGRSQISKNQTWPHQNPLFAMSVWPENPLLSAS